MALTFAIPENIIPIPIQEPAAQSCCVATEVAESVLVPTDVENAVNEWQMLPPVIRPLYVALKLRLVPSKLLTRRIPLSICAVVVQGQGENSPLEITGTTSPISSDLDKLVIGQFKGSAFTSPVASLAAVYSLRTPTSMAVTTHFLDYHLALFEIVQIALQSTEAWSMSGRLVETPGPPMTWSMTMDFLLTVNKGEQVLGLLVADRRESPMEIWAA